MSKLSVLAVAAGIFAVGSAPLYLNPPVLSSPAYAAGPGGVGGSVGGPHGAAAQGMATAAAAVDPSTTGLDKAYAVVSTTPADQQALDSIAAAQEEQAGEETDPEVESEMTFSEALGNMADDARSALSAMFGSAAE